MNKLWLTTIFIVTSCLCTQAEPPKNQSLLLQPIEGGIFAPIGKYHLIIQGGSTFNGGMVLGYSAGLNNFKINYGMKLFFSPRHVDGVNLTDNITWNQQPEDYVNITKSQTGLHAGIGYITQLFYLNLFAGRIENYEYLQSFDKTKNMSDSGNYFVSRKNKSNYEAMLEAGIHYKFLTTSITVSPNLGLGWTFGLIFKQD
jgi:hypothetical protein